MRFTTGLVVAALATGTMAKISPDCPQHHFEDVAKYSDCGDATRLSSCVSKLKSLDAKSWEQCYLDAGCSANMAVTEAEQGIRRCGELEAFAMIKAKYHTLVDRAPQAQATPPPRSGDACLSTTTIKTTTCPLLTENGKVKKGPCTPTEIASATCSPGLLCTHDSSGAGICMVRRDQLDTGGLIIAIAFATIIAIGIGFLTFMCCKEKRDRKRASAKAEAVALARAQTKKKRAQDARAPLMSQQEGGSADPFHDQHHS